MDDAAKAVELLICDDYEEAQFKASQLDVENTHRHTVESNIIESVCEQIAENPSLADDRIKIGRAHV